MSTSQELIFTISTPKSVHSERLSAYALLYPFRVSFTVDRLNDTNALNK